MELDRIFQQLAPDERAVLLDFCDLLLFTLPDLRPSRRAYLDITGARYLSVALKLCAGQANTHARMAGNPAEPALQHHGARSLWHLHQWLCGPAGAVAPPTCPTSTDTTPPDFAALRRLEATPDDAFIERVYWTLLNRAPSPEDAAHWQARLHRQPHARDALLAQGLQALEAQQRADAARGTGNGPAFCIMGTGQPVTVADWQARRAEITAHPERAAPVPTVQPSGALPNQPRPLVSVITSVYAAGQHIQRFMANITQQQGFNDWAELIIIDAASPDAEAAVIQPFTRRHSNIHYTRTKERIGIYAAWNLAIAQAKGEYLTNANVDDLRRADSLALQAAALHQRPEVDIVYQDFFYTLDPQLTYPQVAAMGYRSALPATLDAAVMTQCNPPHHAPMWRKRLHHELGGFDARYQSAGDFEFWLRCLGAGKRFLKLDELHAVYFQNPQGVSTRPGTAGVVEARQSVIRHRPRLVGTVLVGTGKWADTTLKTQWPV